MHCIKVSLLYCSLYCMNLFPMAMFFVLFLKGNLPVSNFSLCFSLSMFRYHHTLHPKPMLIHNDVFYSRHFIAQWIRRVGGRTVTKTVTSTLSRRETTTFEISSDLTPVFLHLLSHSRSYFVSPLSSPTQGFQCNLCVHLLRRIPLLIEIVDEG